MAKAKPRKAVWETVSFSGFAGMAYPTDDGRWLRVDSDTKVIAALTIRNETRYAEKVGTADEDGDLPTDILSADLRLADQDGQLWQATSTFDASLFVAQMIDLTRIDTLPFREFVARKRRSRTRKITANPDAQLAAVVFSSDDRFIREFAIQTPREETGKSDGVDLVTKVVRLQFKYTTLFFDVSFTRPHAGIEMLEHMLDLTVRLHEGCAHDYETFEDIGPLVFTFGWEVLFRHHLYARTPAGDWHGSGLPLPLIFRSVKGSEAVQAHVCVS
ncbi:hypothetical protein TA3x_004189 [Tundrisphaera sp. TA3]|uniref:hypothetical protein n=1 Tax=Tundrisphaera sp. TA3 TaxID=3435775 RepID=UPI003EBE2B2C